MSILPQTLPFTLGVTEPERQYARQLKQLLPPGQLFKLTPQSVLTKTLTAVAGEFARVDTRAANLLNEYDPSTATEMLEDWERALGLPDSCLTEIPSTVEDRRKAILLKYAGRGGQTKQFYIDLAAKLGLVISISVFKVCRSGQARSGDRCYTDAWAYAWLVKLPIGDTTSGAVAGSLLPVNLGTHGTFGIECVIQRAAPAHTVVLFSYT